MAANLVVGIIFGKQQQHGKSKSNQIRQHTNNMTPTQTVCGRRKPQKLISIRNQQQIAKLPRGECTQIICVVVVLYYLL